jgi:hypothetical protein
MWYYLRVRPSLAEVAQGSTIPPVSLIGVRSNQFQIPFDQSYVLWNCRHSLVQLNPKIALPGKVFGMRQTSSQNSLTSRHDQFLEIRFEGKLMKQLGWKLCLLLLPSCHFLM